MKKTKLVPITSLDQLEVGSIIVYEDGNKCQILARSGLIVAKSILDNYKEHNCWTTLNELQDEGYQLEVTEEPWVPREGEEHYCPYISEGRADLGTNTWKNNKHDQSRLKTGLVCKTKEEALVKAQKMLNSIKDSE